jgi:outer membrane protein insertion porin family
VFAEVSQANFDLFNRRSFLPGRRPEVPAPLQLGSLSSEAVLSFEEPWLFQRQLALGFSVFRTSSEYNSDVLQQIADRRRVYLRKRPLRALEGRLSYTYEVIDIEDVSPFIRADHSGARRTATVSSIGFQLLRDTRDKIINTTSGNRVEVNTALAGGFLGGRR